MKELTVGVVEIGRWGDDLINDTLYFRIRAIVLGCGVILQDEYQNA